MTGGGLKEESSEYINELNKIKKEIDIIDKQKEECMEKLKKFREVQKTELDSCEKDFADGSPKPKKSETQPQPDSKPKPNEPN